MEKLARVGLMMESGIGIGCEGAIGACILEGVVREAEGYTATLVGVGMGIEDG